MEPAGRAESEGEKWKEEAAGLRAREKTQVREVRAHARERDVEK